MRYLIFSILGGLAAYAIWPFLVDGWKWLVRNYTDMREGLKEEPEAKIESEGIDSAPKDE